MRDDSPMVHLARALRGFVVSVGIVSVVACSASPEGADSFDHYFELMETVRLSNDVPIGDIHYLDVDRDGRFLVTDFPPSGVYLFESDGRFIRQLTAEPCDPGFTMRPIRGLFDPSNGILLLNAGPWGYRFASNGECMGGVDESFAPPSGGSCFMSDGTYVGYYNTLREPGVNLVRHMDRNGVLIWETEAPPSRFGNLEQRFAVDGTVACSASGSTFLTTVTNAEIWIFDARGRHVDTIDNPPGYSVSVSQDAAPFGDARFSASFRAALDGRTFSAKLGFIEDDMLVVQYVHDRNSVALDVLSMDGERLIEDDLWLPSRFHHFGRGHLYRAVRAEADEDGEYPNPAIEIYRMRRDLRR